MSTVLTSSRKPSGRKVLTAADLMRRLGDIPPERIWLEPAPGTATEKDVIEAEVKYNRICELVDGTLVEKTMGAREGREALVLGTILETYADNRDIGLVFGTDATMRIMPNLVRIPDVSVVFWNRLPGRELPSEPIPNLVPNVAIEVLSEGNTPKEMKRKLGEYFDAGVEQVWLVDGEARTFEVFSSRTKSIVFSGKETIKTGELFPGLKLSVDAFFNRVHRKR